MKMTLAELKEIVDELVDEHGEEAAEEIEIRWAAQPSWPMEYAIDTQVIKSPDQPIIYFAEDKQLGYLPGEIKEALSW